MKKLLLAVLLIPSFALGARNQPQNIGSVKADVLALPIYTVATMNTLTPDATGQLIFVSDAVTSKVCVSTGAAGASVIGAFVAVSLSTGTVSATAFHCN